MLELSTVAILVVSGAIIASAVVVSVVAVINNFLKKGEI